MWKRFIEISLKLFDLTRTVDKQGKEILELEKRQRSMQQELDRLTLIFQKDMEKERAEREKLVLQLEVLLLRQQLEQKQSRELPPRRPDFE